MCPLHCSTWAPPLGAVEVLIGFLAPEIRRVAALSGPGPAVLLELVIAHVFLRLSW